MYPVLSSIVRRVSIVTFKVYGSFVSGLASTSNCILIPFNVIDIAKKKKKNVLVYSFKQRQARWFLCVVVFSVDTTQHYVIFNVNTVKSLCLHISVHD